MARTNKATCIRCGLKGIVKTEMTRVDSVTHNYKYIHNECIGTLERYSKENDKRIHLEKLHGTTWSIELETSDRTLASEILNKYDFIPTSDSSVKCEWKSPIWNSLCGLNKLFRTIETLVEVKEDASTHLNIGASWLNWSSLELINKYYRQLFVPLADHLRDQPDICKHIFGRTLTFWASHPDNFIQRMDWDGSLICRDNCIHRLFINLEHKTHIEFRVSTFTTANNYMRCIKYCTDLMSSLYNNFIQYKDDSFRSEVERNEFFQKQAKKFAKKSILLLAKYSN